MALRLPTFAGSPALVVSVAAVYGAILTILIFTTGWGISIPLVAATVFPLVLYASRNPRLLFLVGMVMTAPLGLSSNFRVQTHMGGAFSISINLMDFFMVPLLIFLARDFYVGYRRDFKFSAVSAWWVGLMVLGAYWIVIGPYREKAALEVLQMFKHWLLFLVIVNECVREKHFRVVVTALSVTALFNAAIAFAQFFLKHELGLQSLGEAGAASTAGANLGVYGDEGGVYRVNGVMGHANLYGPYLALLLPLFVAWLYSGASKISKLAPAAAIGTGVICLGLTLSRSSWISFVASGGFLMLAIFALPQLRGRKVTLKIGMLVSTVAVLLASLGPIIRRFTQSDPGAFDFRLEWMGVAWKMVQDNPIVGIGMNAFIYNLSGYSPYSTAKMYDLFGDVFPVVHNIYMILWTEQGTIGLFIFLCMHANILWIGIQNLRFKMQSDQIYLISLASTCGVIAIMVDGMSSFFIRVQAPARMFWIVVGLIVAARYWNERNVGSLRDPATATLR